MIELKHEELIRAIGVSNFSTGRLADFALQTPVIPAVNQIELHPYKQHKLIQKADKEFGTLTQAWALFIEERMVFFQDPTLLLLLKNMARQLPRSSSDGKPNKGF